VETTCTRNWSVAHNNHNYHFLLPGFKCFYYCFCNPSCDVWASYDHCLVLVNDSTFCPFWICPYNNQFAQRCGSVAGWCGQCTCANQSLLWQIALRVPRAKPCPLQPVLGAYLLVYVPCWMNCLNPLPCIPNSQCIKHKPYDDQKFVIS